MVIPPPRLCSHISKLNLLCTRELWKETLCHLLFQIATLTAMGAYSDISFGKSGISFGWLGPALDPENMKCLGLNEWWWSPKTS